MNNLLAPGSHVLVIGGGVVGASSAYALVRAGYSVTLATAGMVGDGATSGNAGLLVPADSVVWPGPTNARAVPATLLGKGGSSIQVAWGKPLTLPWGLRFLANSTNKRYRAACRATHALSVHSMAVASEWAHQGSVGTDLKATGMVFLVDSADAIEEFRHARVPLTDEGETYVEMDRDTLVAKDPGYAALPTELRALYSPGAARGDSRAFAQALAARLRRSGARVLERQAVLRLILQNGRAIGASTATGDIPADAVVLAAGFATRELARTAGLRVPILPVKGYVTTVPVRDGGRAPDLGGVLESHHVAYSRMGDRLRLSTGAEIGRDDHDVTDTAKIHLHSAGELLFPRALDWDRAEYGAEHRPMTPTGLPLVGPTKVAGLYLNSGHGSLGWTQAAGSADLLAHLVAGTPAPIEPAPFLPIRPIRSSRSTGVVPMSLPT